MLHPKFTMTYMYFSERSRRVAGLLPEGERQIAQVPGAPAVGADYC